MAVQHHLDQPLMSVKELDIAPGFETQIAVSPLLYSTTKEALHRFKPEERCEIFGAFSPLVPSKREKCTSFAHFVCFLGEVCLLFNF